MEKSLMFNFFGNFITKRIRKRKTEWRMKVGDDMYDELSNIANCNGHQIPTVIKNTYYWIHSLDRYLAPLHFL
jgi:hypothetical protein